MGTAIIKWVLFVAWMWLFFPYSVHSSPCDYTLKRDAEFCIVPNKKCAILDKCMDEAIDNYRFCIQNKETYSILPIYQEEK